MQPAQQAQQAQEVQQGQGDQSHRTGVHVHVGAQGNRETGTRTAAAGASQAHELAEWGLRLNVRHQHPHQQKTQCQQQIVLAGHAVNANARAYACAAARVDGGDACESGVDANVSASVDVRASANVRVNDGVRGVQGKAFSAPQPRLAHCRL